MNKILSKSNCIYIFFYVTFLISFFFGEDSIGGSKIDFYQTTIETILSFQNSIKETLLNYADTGARHSPIFFIVSSIIFSEKNILIFRILILHINLITIIYFYRCLKIKYPLVKNENIKIFSCLIFLLPTYRAYSIWPDSYNIGILFFVISIFYFLKFKAFGKYKYSFYCVIFYAISSYFSPNFSVFSIFFMLDFLRNKNLNNFHKIYLILLNILLSLPALYYVFILKINFFHFAENVYGYEENVISLNNLSNKIIIIPTIILIFFMPIFWNATKYLNIKKEKINYFFILIIFGIYLIAIQNFSYVNVEKYIGGGGLIYKFSKIIFKNYILLYLISFFASIFILKFILKKKNYFLLYFLIYASYPQLSIYYAYFDLLLYLIFFLLMNEVKNNFFNIKNIIIINAYLFVFLIINLFKKELITSLTSLTH
jgi:hypothetical protein